MRRVLARKDAIGKTAMALAPSRTFWAAVGSGPNKSAADEIRIKLSELCYRTISSDFVEDKKHIDLSSEPLIIVCAAGTRSSVIGDIIKDTAIFHAHKAVPVVIAEEDDHRFDNYARQIIHVPSLPEHLSPLLTTLAGHIWGYYAALSIHAASGKLFEERERLQAAVEEMASRGLDVYEITQSRNFRAQMTTFGATFRRMVTEENLSKLVDAKDATDLLLLSRYLAGRIPTEDFELDFGETAAPKKRLAMFFEALGEIINQLSRPVDAIKHQAKTVTVGTSRITEEVSGVLFDQLETLGIPLSRLASRNVLVLRNLQGVVAAIEGGILYRIDGLNLLGEATEATRIHVENKTGTSKGEPSRVEVDGKLRGTKSIIVREGNVFVGRGKKDDRKILVIPLLSEKKGRTRSVDGILSLNVTFKEGAPLFAITKALGGKFERIQNNLQEFSVSWMDGYLDLLTMEELFGLSAEKIVDEILARRSSRP